MRNVRQNLIQKIKKDTGFKIQSDWEFRRPTLSWQHRSAGRFIWFYYTDNGDIVGSSEKMTELLKCERIKLHSGSNYGFYEFSTS
jgi:hypothetical protein